MNTINATGGDVKSSSAHKIRRASRVRELSKMSKARLEFVEAKRIEDAGMRAVTRGVRLDKDGLVARILELEGLS